MMTEQGQSDRLCGGPRPEMAGRWRKGPGAEQGGRPPGAGEREVDPLLQNIYAPAWCQRARGDLEVTNTK